jgi:adenosylmethionine-8-amino-7-oxononanoate aminotransferase
MFACEQANITPDFLCLAKGLSGGYLPLSVVMTTDSIYQSFYHDEATRGFLHSHTHAGNALACCAALATLDIFEQDKITKANHAKINYLNDISQLIASHPKVKNFRNCGMIWAFEVETIDPSFSGKFFQTSLNQGLLLRPLGNTVYFMPPYIINDQEMDFLVAGILQVLDSY